LAGARGKIGRFAMRRPTPARTFWIVMLLWASAPGAPAAQIVPADARQAYARAIDLESQGNYSAALALLWRAAGAAPHDPDVQNRLGEALERIGALDAAIDAYRRAVAERPAHRKASNNLILTLVKAGKGPEAVARARALVAEDPADADRMFTLGLAQSEQDIDEAITTFRRVLQLNPRHTLAGYNLGLVLKRADRLAEAADVLKRALEKEPRAETQYLLGVIAWQQGDTEQAVRALQAAAAANPQYTDAHYTLGAVLASRKDWNGASAALRRAIALHPELPGAHYTLGRVLQQRGDEAGGKAELALADRLRTRAAMEQEAGVWTAVGSRSLESGDLTGALDQFRRATAVFEGYAPAHYQMGLVLQRLGDPVAAAAAFARAAQLNPGLAASQLSR
jgi:tetratricopeptide (TPR) repeat protein